MHKNASLTNVGKFNYLRTLLDGPALNSIIGLPLTELNYKEAIDILTDRFGNKQIIISSHSYIHGEVAQRIALDCQSGT